MENLLTLQEALLEAKDKTKKEESKLYKIGKVASYFKKAWTMETGHKYDELKKGSFDKADGFLAGENNFIINKKSVELDGHTVYKAVDDEFDRFYIYVDKSGTLFTDIEDKKGLYSKILK